MRRCLVLLLLALSVAVPSTVLIAPPASAATCNFVQTTDGHTVRATCTKTSADSGNQYKVIVQFCNQG